MSASVACTLTLPDDFRHADLLAFHGRDAQQVAERVCGPALEKGLLWAGAPACLRVESGPREVTATLSVDGPGAPPPAAELAERVAHLLGLSQPVAAFEAAYLGHAEIGPLLRRRPGLRVCQAATPFEALTWAITGQQISLHAAISLRRRLILAAGLRHSGGLACYPDAQRLAQLDMAELRRAGLSRSKAETLLDLSRAIVAGELSLAPDPASLPDLAATLLARRGIGPWTVNYTLLRGFAWLDGSLHGDAAVRRGLQRLRGREVTPRETERWLAPFSPWRALVAAHLWGVPAAGA